jgi:F-type H+-transporting ATPase subunit a
LRLDGAANCRAQKKSVLRASRKAGMTRLEGREVVMDHHTSWFSFMPGYEWLLHKVQSQDLELLARGGTSTVHHVYAAALVILILAILSFIARSRIADTEKAIIPPKKFGIVAFFELFLEILFGLMESIIGPTYKRYVPLIGTLGLFILVSNLLGLIPGMVPPTDNLNTTLACGVVVFVYFNYHGIRTNGIHHFLHIANPIGAWWGWFLSPLLLPVELISVCVRPITLGIRLAANMIGDHALLFAFAGIFPLLLPLPFYALGLLVCLVQTAVFVILSCVYIALHTAEHEGEGHH